MDKTLIVTNDFPPRPGGIQAFVHSMALRLDPAQVVVYASTWRDGSEVAAFDADQPFPVVRDRTTMLLPTPGSPGARPGCCANTAAPPSSSARPPRSP